MECDTVDVNDMIGSRDGIVSKDRRERSKWPVGSRSFSYLHLFLFLLPFPIPLLFNYIQLINPIWRGDEKHPPSYTFVIPRKKSMGKVANFFRLFLNMRMEGWGLLFAVRLH